MPYSMALRRHRALIGAGMVIVGLVQVVLFAVESRWLPTGLGTLYAGLGVAYLWAEVYRVE